MGRVREILQEKLDKGEIERVGGAGFIRRTNKRKRGRLYRLGKRFKTNTFYRLAWIITKFKEDRIHIQSLDFPILVDIIQELLSCNRSTAYEYANIITLCDIRT